MSVLSPITGRINALRNYAGSYAWPPLVNTTRHLCIGLFKGIQIGRLEIVDADGRTEVCGTAVTADGPNATIVVQNEIFWLRLALFADMGFAESYMLGEVACTDLTAFFKLFILNKPYLSNGTTITSAIAGSLAGLLRATNSLSNSRLNTAAHYDISNDMFAAFLSPDMTYSCPVWSPNFPKYKNETLEEAQHRKLKRFIDACKIKGSDHVLEIGTGWGSFAIKAVRETGCAVTSLTLSLEQKLLAEQRIKEAGLSDKIQVLLCDYRKAPLREGGQPYDKIVSIEMLEAVGRDWLNTYFGQVDKLLKKDGGIAAFQCITIPEGRYEAYAKSDDFIRRYIFPGGHLPSVAQLVAAIDTGSNHNLSVDNIENIGPHYAKTLRLWREQFMRNFESDIRPALIREGQASTKEEVETFKHKWEYYFSYCEAGFATKTLGDVIITVGREGATEMMENVPL